MPLRVNTRLLLSITFVNALSEKFSWACKSKKLNRINSVIETSINFLFNFCRAVINKIGKRILKMHFPFGNSYISKIACYIVNFTPAKYVRGAVGP